jgi:hypothetical protein
MVTGGYNPTVRRSFRYLRTTLTALSLLLCLAAAGDWVKSYRCYWFAWHSAVDGSMDIGSDMGALYFVRADVPISRPGFESS